MLQNSPCVRRSERYYLRAFAVLATAAVLCAPILLYAYLGQFSRLMSDDYCAIAIGQELGAWNGMRYWYDNWAGSYANFFFKSAIAPLGAMVPAITPPLILAVWWLATAYLLSQALKISGVLTSQRTTAALLAALTVVAGVNALYSPQSFFWFAASTHYTLPLALLTAYLGLILRAARVRHAATAVGFAIVGAIICFVSGGASEIHVAFQLVFLTLCALPMLWIRRRRAWFHSALTLGAGWLATLLALLLQLASPGLAIRAAYDSARFGHALRTPAELIRGVVELTVEQLGHPPAFAGFVLLLAAALLITLLHYRPSDAHTNGSALRLAKRPLVAGLAFQLLWLPLIWTHASDAPRYFGRFSGGFVLVALLNALFIALFALMIRLRRRLNDGVFALPNAHYAFVAFCLMVALAPFAMTQIRSIHFRAAAYLFTTAISLLAVYGGAALVRG